MDLPYGDELPYWKTSNSSAESWVSKTIAILAKFGAKEISEGFAASGAFSSYVILFRFGAEQFRIVWPVMKYRNPEDQKSARVQAATLMYHDCKSRAVTAKALGVRTAFIGQLLLADNKTVQESATPLIAEQVKPMALIGQDIS